MLPLPASNIPGFNSRSGQEHGFPLEKKNHIVNDPVNATKFSWGRLLKRNQKQKISLFICFSVAKIHHFDLKIHKTRSLLQNYLKLFFISKTKNPLLSA